MPVPLKTRALMIGMGVTLGSLTTGCAGFTLTILSLAGGNDLAAGWAFLIFSPTLIWLLVASIGLGLWQSHRTDRRSIAMGDPRRTDE